MTTADFPRCPACPTHDACGMVGRCLDRQAAPAAARPGPPVPPRAAVLREAEALICGDRQRDYGPPAESFGRLAAMWSAYLGHPVTAAQVCGCMALLKLSRLAHDATSRDGARDLAGYAALMHEVAHHAPARDLPVSGPLSASQADMAGGE